MSNISDKSQRTPAEEEEQSPRCLAWEGCYNAREVGDYPIESGGRTRMHTLLRSDTLHGLTPKGQAALRDYGVRTIIDLRLADELERQPNPFAAQQGPDGVPRYVNLPIHDPAITAAVDAAQATEGEYIVILEESKGLVAAIIKAVSASLEDGAVLVHCHGGKDRTGIVIALLLSLAGVPREIIAQDYALTETRLEPLYAAWLEEQSKTQGRPIERPQWMFSRPEKMLSLLDYLDREYGSVEGYLETAGATQADMARIREHLTALP
jgi:protein-tyrosine phosphatase